MREERRGENRDKIRDRRVKTVSAQLSCGKCITCTIRIGSEPARRKKK